MSDIKFLQHIYASVSKGYDGIKGYQTLALSKGLTNKEIIEILKLISYSADIKVNNKEDLSNYPLKIVFFRLSSGRYIISRVKYIGKDYTGRLGNFIAHTLITEEKNISVLPFKLLEYVEKLDNPETFRYLNQLFKENNIDTALERLESFVDYLSDKRFEIEPLIVDGNNLSIRYEDIHLKAKKLLDTLGENKAKIILKGTLKGLKENEKVIIIDKKDSLLKHFKFLTYTLHINLWKDKLFFSTFEKDVFRGKFREVGTIPEAGFYYTKSDLRSYIILDLINNISSDLKSRTISNFVDELVNSLKDINTFENIYQLSANPENIYIDCDEIKQRNILEVGIKVFRCLSKEEILERLSKYKLLTIFDFLKRANKLNNKFWKEKLENLLKDNIKTGKIDKTSLKNILYSYPQFKTILDEPEFRIDKLIKGENQELLRMIVKIRQDILNEKLENILNNLTSLKDKLYVLTTLENISNLEEVLKRINIEEIKKDEEKDKLSDYKKNLEQLYKLHRIEYIRVLIDEINRKLALENDKSTSASNVDVTASQGKKITQSKNKSSKNDSLLHNQRKKKRFSIWVNEILLSLIILIIFIIIIYFNKFIFSNIILNYTQEIQTEKPSGDNYLFNNGRNENNILLKSHKNNILILKEVYDNDICKGIEGIKDVKCKIEEKDGRTKYILYIPFVKDDYEAERKLAEILKNKKIFELIKDKNEFKYINEEKEEKVVNKMFASIYLDNNNKKEENIEIGVHHFYKNNEIGNVVNQQQNINMKTDNIKYTNPISKGSYIHFDADKKYLFSWKKFLEKKGFEIAEWQGKLYIKVKDKKEAQGVVDRLARTKHCKNLGCPKTYFFIFDGKRIGVIKTKNNNKNSNFPKINTNKQTKSNNYKEKNKKRKNISKKNYFTKLNKQKYKKIKFATYVDEIIKNKTKKELNNVLKIICKNCQIKEEKGTLNTKLIITNVPENKVNEIINKLKQKFPDANPKILN